MSALTRQLSGSRYLLRSPNALSARCAPRLGQWLYPTVRCGLCRYKSKKKAFCHYAKKYSDGSKGIQADLDQLRKQATVIRVLAHTQIGKIGFGQKKAHLSEIQVFLLLLIVTEGQYCLLGPVELAQQCAVCVARRLAACKSFQECRRHSASTP